MPTRSRRSAARRRNSERGALIPWLLPASALHAALLLAWLASRLPDITTTRTAPDSSSEREELGWIDVDVKALTELPRDDPAPSVSGGGAAAAPPRRASRPAAPGPAREAVTFVSPASPTPPSSSEADVVAAPARPETSSAPSDEPHLSLDQLGVGARHNPFLALAAPEVPLRSVLNQRVQQMLQTGLAAHDQEVGLGPEGPAVALAEKIVWGSATQPNTSGLLLIRTDASGVTVHVEVLDADAQGPGWQRIAEELKRELAKTPLRVPRGSSGVSFQLRVVSRVQLPSGADPGLAVDLLGITVKNGEGDRSSRISVLSPEVSVAEIDVPYSNGATMPMVGFKPNILSFAGDLADIGAVARRVVRAHLVALETHVNREGAE